LVKREETAQQTLEACLLLVKREMTRSTVLAGLTGVFSWLLIVEAAELLVFWA
jgi:hypothetical protein